MQSHYLTDTLCTYIVCLVQGCQECDKQYVITADGKNVPVFYNTSIHTLRGGFLSFARRVAVNAYTACSVMFTILHVSLVMAVDSFFKKSRYKEVRWRKVWQSWWPSPRPTLPSLKYSCQKAVVFPVSALNPSCWNHRSRSFSLRANNQVKICGQFSAVMVCSEKSGPTIRFRETTLLVWPFQYLYTSNF